MNKKLIIVFAFLFLTLGLIEVMDWIIFCNQPGNDSLPFLELKEKYYDRFPPLLEGYFRSVVSTLVCMLFFLLAGLLFLRLKTKPYRVVAFVTFALAFWQLFSLM